MLCYAMHIVWFQNFIFVKLHKKSSVHAVALLSSASVFFFNLYLDSNLNFLN
jgi:hypothetical protein